MKKSDELKQQRLTLRNEMDALLTVAEMTDDQKRQFDDLEIKLTALDADISRQERIEARLLESGGSGRNITPKEEKEISTYSFARAIRLICENKPVDGLEGEMHQEGMREFAALGKSVKGLTVPSMVLNQRASAGQNVTTAADGGNLVQADPFIFIESLKNALVLSKMGATFLPNLVGNVPLLKGGAFAASWVAEGSAVSFTKESFGKSTLTPKNLLVAGAISKQLLVQTNNVADRMIRDEMVKAIALGIEAAAINGSGAPAPTGILNTDGIGAVVGGANGLIPTWGNIVDLESAVKVANGMPNISYLTNAKVAGKLKQTLKAAGVAGYIMDGGAANGYPVFVTNAVPSTLTKGNSDGICSAIIAGDFSELFVGMWGGLDIVVDPYTRADYNEVKLVLNQFADVALRNAASFAAMKDALTA